MDRSGEGSKKSNVCACSSSLTFPFLLFLDGLAGDDTRQSRRCDEVGEGAAIRYGSQEGVEILIGPTNANGESSSKGPNEGSGR